MSTSSKTVAFLGATGGCGLSALGRSLAAGHTCVALCRTPSNLTTIQGDAKDPGAVAKILVSQSDPKRIVDVVIFSIGAAFHFSTMSIDDLHVCAAAMDTLVKALAAVRSEGAVGNPKIVAISSTGLSPHARDIPLPMVPLYHWMLKIPHEDKKLMEKTLAKSGEEYAVVRASALVNGGQPQKKIRVGIEDLDKGVYEHVEIGYTISREDVGRWIFENLIDREWQPEYSRKAVAVTW